MTSEEDRESYPNENPLDDMRVNKHGKPLSDSEYNSQLGNPSYRKAAEHGVRGITKFVRDLQNKKNK